MWLGITWYHLAVPQSLQCPGPPHMIPLAHYLLCSFTGYTEALALKPVLRGVKSLVTSKRRAKNPASSCSSLDACMCFASLLWKDLLALGKVNRANMYSPFQEQVQSVEKVVAICPAFSSISCSIPSRKIHRELFYHENCC